MRGTSLLLTNIVILVLQRYLLLEAKELTEGMFVSTLLEIYLILYL